MKADSPLFGDDGKPRYWLGTYDAWHLLLPIVLVASVGFLLLKPASTIKKVTPRLPPPLPLVILAGWSAPAPGSLIKVSQFNQIQGSGFPNGQVILWMKSGTNLEQKITVQRVQTNGLFSIGLSRFPVGNYRFRAEVIDPINRRSSTPEIPIRILADSPQTNAPVKPSKSARKRRKT
ncbi:MAG: hypothetical protein EXS25_03660 [Pedosphaera sp.]|nr:hypothetical protein [Pedosphaera sp.]